MATARPMPEQAELPREAASPPSAEGGQQALVPAAQFTAEESEFNFSPAVSRLPVELDVAIPVREFRVRHLLALEPGWLVESQWSHGNDLPLAAGKVQLAWTEFEVVETRLAVRITRIA